MRIKGKTCPKHSESMKRLYRNGYINPMKGKKATKKMLESLKLGRLKGQKKDKIRGDNHWTRRIGFSEESKKRMSETRKRLFREGKIKPPITAMGGENHSSYGIKLTKESKKRIGDKARKRWNDPEFAKKNAIAFNTRPTKPELIVQKILKELNSNLRYNGDGREFSIAGRIPDFVDVDNKQVIEVFGEYWHSPLLNPSLKIRRTYKETMEDYRNVGYECLIIWQHELDDMDKVKERIEILLNKRKE